MRLLLGPIILLFLLTFSIAYPYEAPPFPLSNFTLFPRKHVHHPKFNPKKGINCKGSLFCHKRAEHSWMKPLHLFHQALVAARDEGYFPGGDYAFHPPRHIICLRGPDHGQQVTQTLPKQGKPLIEVNICLFLQGDVGAYGTSLNRVIEKLSALEHYGCETCGSIPLSDRRNNGYEGVLTANMVQGWVCPQPGICLYTPGGLFDQRMIYVRYPHPGEKWAIFGEKLKGFVATPAPNMVQGPSGGDGGFGFP